MFEDNSQTPYRNLGASEYCAVSLTGQNNCRRRVAGNQKRFQHETGKAAKIIQRVFEWLFAPCSCVRARVRLTAGFIAQVIMDIVGGYSLIIC